MSQSNNSSTGGIGLSGALFLLFLGLKLGNVITWPWVLVFAPLWIPLGVVVICLIIILIIKIFS
jgi:hypothetical protein